MRENGPLLVVGSPNEVAVAYSGMKWQWLENRPIHGINNSTGEIKRAPVLGRTCRVIQPQRAVVRDQLEPAGAHRHRLQVGAVSALGVEALDGRPHLRRRANGSATANTSLQRLFPYLFPHFPSLFYKCIFVMFRLQRGQYYLMTL